MNERPLLDVRGVVKHFGGLAAVDAVNLCVHEGSITALIGPNGAGKTTLFNLITGFSRPERGAIRFAGRGIEGLPPHRIARRGLVRTFQTAKVFRRMKVIENLLVSSQRQPGEQMFRLLARPRAVIKRDQELLLEAREVLHLLGLQRHANEYAGTLSGGERKLLEFGRALMVAPRMILLDEPMAGVNPSLGERLVEHICFLRETRGITFFLIEHDLRTVMRISDTVIVLSDGRAIAEGPPSAVRSDPGVVDAYLGADTVGA